MTKPQRAKYAWAMPEHWSIQYLRHVLKAQGVAATRLATMAGVSQSTITRPLNSDDHAFAISRATLDKVQAATGIPYASFADGVPDETGQPAPRGQLVSVYDVQASAGHGSFNDTEIVVDRLAFPPGYLQRVTKARPENLAIIGVKGDSMFPTLKDDDVVMLDKTKTSLGFDGLFVLQFDGALHVKRVGRASAPGHVMIISDNRAEYMPIERRIDDVEVVGKVIWMGKKV